MTEKKVNESSERKSSEKLQVDNESIKIRIIRQEGSSINIKLAICFTQCAFIDDNNRHHNDKLTDDSRCTGSTDIFQIMGRWRR